jgi:mannose-1-phosphate guanylyltransferase
MKFNERDARCHRWGVILAGGDGERLPPLTRRIVGDDRPKQFCAITGKETLLHQTQRRISRLVPRLRTVLVLTRSRPCM